MLQENGGVKSAVIAGELVEYISQENSGRIQIRAGEKCGPTISSLTIEETYIVLFFAYKGNNGRFADVVRVFFDIFYNALRC